MPGRKFFAVLMALWAGFVFSAAGADSGVAFKHENKLQNLQALFELIHHTVHVRKDTKQAAALINALLPDEARTKKALKDGIEPDALRQILDMHKQLGSISPDAAPKFVSGPDQKMVRVHAATTEEIVRFAEDSVAYKAFPGGMRRIARQALRPGMTFYEVEYHERGKNAAVKFDLLYWDGRQWTMLGPVWRLFKR